VLDGIGKHLPNFFLIGHFPDFQDRLLPGDTPYVLPVKASGTILEFLSYNLGFELHTCLIKTLRENQPSLHPRNHHDFQTASRVLWMV